MSSQYFVSIPPENFWFTGILRGYRNAILAWNVLTQKSSYTFQEKCLIILTKVQLPSVTWDTRYNGFIITPKTELINPYKITLGYS